LARNGQFPSTMVVSEFQTLLATLAPTKQDMWPTSCDGSIFNVLFVNNLLPGELIYFQSRDCHNQHVILVDVNL
jgi:hypothetical protein